MIHNRLKNSIYFKINKNYKKFDIRLKQYGALIYKNRTDFINISEFDAGKRCESKINTCTRFE